MLAAGELEALVDATGACASAARVGAVAALFNLRLASHADIDAGHALAARLIAVDLAAPDQLAAVQDITGASLFVHAEQAQITGVLGFFGVRRRGLDLLETGRFDARNLDLDVVARAAEPPTAVYAYGVAASTKAGGSAIIRASAAIQEALYWAIPVFTRVASEDGARVLLGDLGFVRVASDPSLVRRPPRAHALEGFRAGLAA